MPAQQVLRIFLSFSHRSRPPPNRIPFAVQSDSVRRPIRFRTPSDQIPYAVQSDSVRVTMTFHEVITANIRQAERHIATAQYFFTGKPTYL